MRTKKEVLKSNNDMVEGAIATCQIIQGALHEKEPTKLRPIKVYLEL